MDRETIERAESGRGRVDEMLREMRRISSVSAAGRSQDPSKCTECGYSVGNLSFPERCTYCGGGISPEA